MASLTEVGKTSSVSHTLQKHSLKVYMENNTKIFLVVKVGTSIKLLLQYVICNDQKINIKTASTFQLRFHHKHNQRHPYWIIQFVISADALYLIYKDKRSKENLCSLLHFSKSYLGPWDFLCFLTSCSLSYFHFDFSLSRVKT